MSLLVRCLLIRQGSSPGTWASLGSGCRGVRYASDWVRPRVDRNTILRTQCRSSGPPPGWGTRVSSTTMRLQQQEAAIIHQSETSWQPYPAAHLSRKASPRCSRVAGERVCSMRLAKQAKILSRAANMLSILAVCEQLVQGTNSLCSKPRRWDGSYLPADRGGDILPDVALANALICCQDGHCLFHLPYMHRC